MNELVTSVIGGGVGAVAVIAAVWGTVRSIVEKRLDDHFRKLSSEFDSRMELHRDAADAILQNELAIYPALSQLVYQAKVGADAAAATNNRFNLLTPQFVEACRNLTTQLFSYRVYLPEDIFEELHNFKHLTQDLLLICDVLTRPESMDISTEIGEDNRIELRRLGSEIAEASDRITALLRGRMVELSGPLGSRDN